MTLVNTEYKLISATQADEDAYIGTINVIRQQFAQPWSKLTAEQLQAANGSTSYQGKFVWPGFALNQLAGREVADSSGFYAGSLDPAVVQRITPGSNDSGGGFFGGLTDSLTEMVPGLAFLLTTTAFGSAVSSSLTSGATTTTAPAASEGVATGTVTVPASEASYGLGEAYGGAASPEAVAGGAAPAASAGSGTSSGVLTTIKQGIDTASKAASVARIAQYFLNPTTGQTIKVASGETPPVGFVQTPTPPIDNADTPSVPNALVSSDNSALMIVGVLALIAGGVVFYITKR